MESIAIGTALGVQNVDIQFSVHAAFLELPSSGSDECYGCHDDNILPFDEIITVSAKNAI